MTLLSTLTASSTSRMASLPVTRVRARGVNSSIVIDCSIPVEGQCSFLQGDVPFKTVEPFKVQVVAASVTISTAANGSAVTTRSRLSLLALYRAASAAASNSLGDKPCSGNSATPIDTVIIPTDLP